MQKKKKNSIKNNGLWSSSPWSHGAVVDVNGSVVPCWDDLWSIAVVFYTPHLDTEKSFSVNQSWERWCWVRVLSRIMTCWTKSVSAAHHQSNVCKSNPHWLPVVPSGSGCVVISQRQSNEAEWAAPDPVWEAAVFPSARQPPQRQAEHLIIWDYWFCLSWAITGGAALLHTPTDDNHSDSQQRCTEARRLCVTWSWWSKKVLMHALEPASQTFTLLSEELREAETSECF